MAYLSAGVYIKEIDNSAIVPTVSNSVAFFAGNFNKGVIEQPFVITNKDELEFYFGKPTNENYNEWYQCYKFFDYSNQLVVSRAYTDGAPYTSSINTIDTISENDEFYVEKIDGLYKGTSFKFDNFVTLYTIKDILFIENTGQYLIKLESPTDSGEIQSGTYLIIYGAHQNASIDAYRNLLVSKDSGVYVPPYAQTHLLIKNDSDFDVKQGDIPFNSDVRLKFMGRTPSHEDEEVEISICNHYDFKNYIPSESSTNSGGETIAQAFDGIYLTSLFEHPPTGEQIGVAIRKGGLTESFICSFSETALDGNNKSIYIENVINNNSKIVYVVDNTALGLTTVEEFYEEPTEPAVEYETYVNSYLVQTSQGLLGNSPLALFGAESPTVSPGDIKLAYEEVLDKEQFEVDVIIGNEEDDGVGAIELANARQDCIAMLGARYKDVVGMKSGEVVSNLGIFMQGSDAPLRTMFGSFFGNYARIFDNYSKKFRWINIAGDMAGLRSNTNANQASWWASAGLRRGIIRNIDKLAFSPSLPQRDQLYRQSINPVVSFPGEGNLVWGQKTLLNYSSSFDRINVRGLFNTIERAMAKASRSTVFEFNDPFTRNAILAMFNPYLSTVKAGRGISDFLVICDETNNTPDIISRNELRVDIYIKPNYASEFIILTFNNVGTRSFSSVVGA